MNYVCTKCKKIFSKKVAIHRKNKCSCCGSKLKKITKGDE